MPTAQTNPGDHAPAVARDHTGGEVTRFLGGPAGKLASPVTRGLPGITATLLLVAGFFLLLGFATKANCLSSAPGDGTFSINWSGHRQYISFCYNDIVPLYGLEGFSDGAVPYRYSWESDGQIRYTEYPVATGFFMWLTAAITRAIYPLIHATGFIPLAPAAVFFIVNAVLLSGLWLGTIVLLRRLAGPRPWDVLLAAACPIVIMHAFTNWDMLPIFFAVLAVAAAARGSSTAAGVAIGVGTAFKLWPLFLLGAYLTLAVRHKTFRPFSLMLAGASASWVAINLPVYLAWPDGWMEFWRMNSTRGAEWSTVYALINRLTGYDTFHTADSGPGLLNSISMVAFILCCAAILALGTGARYRPRVAQLIFLILVAFVLTNKVYSPQYSMWLVPFAVLAVGNRPKLVVSWMLADMMLWPILCWTMLGADNKALPDPFLNTIVTLRGVLLVALAVVVVRTIMGKHDDPLAGADGTTDPLAGDFAPPSPRVAGHPAGDQPASGNNCEGAAAPGKDTCA